MMMLYNIIAAVLIGISLILTGIREGFVVKDLLDGKTSPRESKIWHRIGFFIRACQILSITAILYPFVSIIILGVIAGIAILIAGLWYNIVINLINGWKWYYLGSSNDSDGIINKMIKWIRSKIKK